ncbi:hypothetical protein BDW75DRAFT_241494 [Aspergillus navahoensis]
MPARSQSRITTACNSCRHRKQKCSGNRPKCIQCLEHRRNCDWPEQLKRGPAKGYIEALERRLQETESLLLGLLEQVSDSQLEESIPVSHYDSPAQLRSAKRGSEHWRLFPLRSVREIRAWQEDCQRSVLEGASTSTTTPQDAQGKVSPPAVGEEPGIQQARSQARQESLKPQPSIIVVGAGPSGLLLGLLLSKQGVQVEILDAETKVSDQPRAAHYASPAAYELDRAGVLEDVKSRGFTFKTMAWRKPDTTFVAGTTTEHLPADYPHRMVVLPLDQLGELLVEHIQRQPAAHLKWSHRVVKVGQEADHAWVDVETPGGRQRMTADYIIGCDGASSTVRRELFGPEYPGETLNAQIIATNVYYDFSKDFPSDSSFIIHPDNLYMVARITNNGLYRVTYKDIPNLSREGYIARQPKRCEEILPSHPKPHEYKITNISPYKLQQRCAPSFRVGRVLLAADAAHLCNPFGGLGLTSGIADVGSLYDALIGIHKALTDEDILTKYADIRKQIWTEIIDPMSRENFARLHQDADTARENDPFFRLCVQAETDKDLSREIAMGMETPEIGSLTAHSPQESQFVGSSSGVFFINTVRRAFGSTSREFPQPEDTLVGSEDSLHGLRSKTHASTEETPVAQWEYDSSAAGVLGQAPPQQLAKDLMMVYFKVWHPLFPFLHGPTFLRAMEGLYGDGNGNADGESEQTEAEAEPQHQQQQPQNKRHTSTAWTAIFQCVFHLATLITPDLPLPPSCHIQPPISFSIHTLLTPLTARHDLLSLQALLAAQLYLVATMSLRTASTVGGCMLRSMLHAGLHRCPFRYRELSASATSQHCHLRKRIFWSAYALDRYLSQALGLPLGVQDSDIDVCPPGAPEVHRPLQHLPVAGANTIGLSVEEAAAEAERTRRETPFASYVQSGKLTGEALELFHKSIYVRSISQTSVLLLTTSVHKWWNGLDLSPPPPPAPSSSLSEKRGADETPFNYTPFFTVLYHHLLLLLHRPALSLPNGTPEFLSALQSCISAARHILSALNTQKDEGQALFWPGFLSAAWMAGLVLAFACQLGQYVLAKGCAEIENCLEILGTMAGRWEPARHCHRALKVLLRAVSGGSSAAASNAYVDMRSSNDTAGTTGHGAQFHPLTSSASEDVSQSVSATNSRKRRKVELSSAETQLPESTADQETSAESGPTGGNELDTPSEIGGQDVYWGYSMGLDINMVDLLQEGNFDSLMDLFGQQYPTF